MYLAVVVLEFEHFDFGLSVSENQSLNYCVILTGLTDVVLPVDIILIPGGSAQPGTDFQFSPTTLIFQPSTETRICRSVSITEDDIIEHDEGFFLSLSSNRMNGVVIGSTDIEITIFDSTRSPINYLNSSIVVTEGLTVLLCFMISAILERNVSFQIYFNPFGSKSANTH